MESASSKIENFTYTAYKGSWDKMPDFSELKPHKSGKASSGIADPGLAGLSENFGLVFEGEINIKSLNLCLRIGRLAY